MYTFWTGFQLGFRGQLNVVSKKKTYLLEFYFLETCSSLKDVYEFLWL